MERKYKAFISYRHLPLQMSVAKKLHRRIEHFVIPCALRRNGEKKLGYVFRDQDELPLSNDLAGNIRRALDNSEFLIVICTPETKESRWCMEEIDYFLAHHDREHVLAVLADGQAEDAFPPQLTDTYSEAGERIAHVEPLAANIAADSASKRNRLFQVESLRILAALTGCAFDELYRREQRYRIRRVVAAASAVTMIAAAFIGVLLDRNAAIRSNYEQSLRNQSRYLSAESLNRLESGDRLGAIRLATAALPSGEDPRPIISRAQYALECAVGIYTAPGTSGTYATGVLSHPGTVSTFSMNEDGSLLCSMTSENLVTMWDTQKMAKLWSFPLEDDSVSSRWVSFPNDGYVLTGTSREIVCLRPATGETVWRRTADDLNDRSWGSLWAAIPMDDGPTLLAVTSENVLRLDLATGETIRRIELPKVSVDEQAWQYSLSYASSDPKGTLLAARIYTYTPQNQEGVAVIDLTSGELRSLWLAPVGITVAPKPSVFAEDRLVFITWDLTGSSSMSFGSLMFSTNDVSQLHCVDPESGAELWCTDHPHTVTSGNDALRFETGLTENPLLVYTYSNHVDVLDPTDGTMLGHCELPSRVLSTDRVNRVLCCVTGTGDQTVINPNQLGEWTSARIFVDDLIAASSKPGNFWVQPRKNNGELIHYGGVKADPTWQDRTVRWQNESDAGQFFNPDDVRTGDKSIAMLDDRTLILGNAGPDGPFWGVGLPEGGTEYSARYTYTLLGLNGEKLLLAWKNSTSSGVGQAALDTGEVTLFPWSDGERTPICFYSDPAGERLFAPSYRFTEGDDPETTRIELSALVLDPSLELQKEIPIAALDAGGSVMTVMDGREDLFLILPDGKDGPTAYRVEMETGRVSLCTDAFARFLASEGISRDPEENLIWAPDGSRAAFFADKETLRLTDLEGNLFPEIRAETREFCSACFSPDGQELLTVETDCFLRRYRVEDGTLLGKSELYAAGSLVLKKITWDISDPDFLAIGLGNYLNLVSREDWEVFAYVPDCWGYLKATDSFCCVKGSNRNEIGFFPRHTLPDLLDYAGEVLNGWDLSPTQKQQYGLAD